MMTVGLASVKMAALLGGGPIGVIVGVGMVYGGVTLSNEIKKALPWNKSMNSTGISPIGQESRPE